MSAISYGRGEARGCKYMLDLEDIATREVGDDEALGRRCHRRADLRGLSPIPPACCASRRDRRDLIMGGGYYVNDYQDLKNDGRAVDDFARR